MIDATSPPRRDEREDRATLRARLIAARQALQPSLRLTATEAIARRLGELLPRLAPQVLAFYWPFRGEVDCRGAVIEWLAADGRRQAALPVIAAPAMPLVFRRWSPHCALEAGRYGIPVPARDDRVVPDVILMPVVGFDARGYRLGYGGGYYDRTLAALSPRPRTVGVGFEYSRLQDFAAEAQDIPMDWLLTDGGVWQPGAAGE